MPEFILDLGSNAGARQFKGLDDFTQGYIEAMFFTNSGTSDDGELASATFGDLAAETLSAIIRDCGAFQKDNWLLLEEACEFPDYDMAGAGRDFWYTRNGHGVGFWGRHLGNVGELLSDIARECGAVDMCSGDDGRVYLV